MPNINGTEIDFEKQRGYFFNSDCMDGMKAFPDKFFDLAVVDPPYGDGGVTTDSQTVSGSEKDSTATKMGGYHGAIGAENTSITSDRPLTQQPKKTRTRTNGGGYR